MTTFYTKSYYIQMTGLVISDDAMKNILNLLEKHFDSEDYWFTDISTVLIIENIADFEAGERLEGQIERIIKKSKPA